ncbi:MAG: R3H domain-containing nucleic acid-binding protein [Acidimicrobiales bacterium]
MSIGDQADVAKGFLEGLVQAMGLEGSVAVENLTDEEATAQVSGAELGLLVGPGGRTLDALHELSRTVIQRHAGGSPSGRIRIDVGGYRARRKAALEKFVADIAAKVNESGNAQSLEPMGSADRKIAHDAVTDIAGVSTISEGEDPNRRVVIVPND